MITHLPSRWRDLHVQQEKTCLFHITAPSAVNKPSLEQELCFYWSWVELTHQICCGGSLHLKKRKRKEKIRLSTISCCMFYLRVQACAGVEETRTYWFWVFFDCLFMHWVRNRWGHSRPLCSPSTPESLTLFTKSPQPKVAHSQLEATSSTCPWNSLGERTTTLPAEFLKFGSIEQLRIPTKGVRIFSETEVQKLPPPIPFQGTNFMSIHNRVVQGSFFQALSKGKDTGDPLLFLNKGFKLHIQLLF